ncbi:tRNA dimethylallyltransferase [Catalinimonas alkaloidigena]|uniref:tRNA dimethylallyltransferase n=1 Tax=Catalinimonas alkaloidigena TaxID=1075417 RepID=A0A1G9GTA2_9BACT|nr:tRNA (adenosine(37)-N6)-dimethylallyltransferase MiaA [Catalinimonas alkaloidigena]SDL03832.1 tRNA dimethylallyltransferase [Catalinimonas alkaloidigena]
MSSQHLIVVVGPTAVGKTALSVQLAQHFGCEILSADARQFYREMAIGTAKPTPEEQSGVPHHFVDSLSIQDAYSVGAFEREALATLAHLYQRYPVALMTGGSGLYVRAVTEGLDEVPPAAPQLREQLTDRWQQEGLASLTDELCRRDPDYCLTADLQNPHRVIRALEVCLSTGRPFSSFRRATPQARPFRVHKIGLTLPRETLYARIDRRVELMLEAGLQQEAEALFPYRHLTALQTVGYQEIFGWMEGHYDWDEAVRLLKRNTRRYAKRQLTWFRKDPHVRWYAPQDRDEIVSWLTNAMR